MRTFDIDVLNIGLGFWCVPMDQDANTLRKRARHTHLMPTEQGDIMPAEVAGGERWEFGVEIRGSGEDHARNIGAIEVVGVDQQEQ